MIVDTGMDRVTFVTQQGQTELLCFQDPIQGIWGMSYRTFAAPMSDLQATATTEQAEYTPNKRPRLG